MVYLRAGIQGLEKKLDRQGLSVIPSILGFMPADDGEQIVAVEKLANSVVAGLNAGLVNVAIKVQCRYVREEKRTTPRPVMQERGTQWNARAMHSRLLLVTKIHDRV